MADAKTRLRAQLHRLSSTMGAETIEKTPSERLLDLLGPVETFYDLDEVGDWGNPARMHLDEYLEPFAEASPQTRLGPIDKVVVFWFAGMSCDGCTISTLGASSPPLESMMLGAQPGLPQVMVHHYALSLESGPHYASAIESAVRGDIDSPYVIVLEGSATDETIPNAYGGHWAGNGVVPWGPGGEERMATAEEFVARLAPNAAAAIAIGTCATWGGIPSSTGNATGAMSLMDFLGKDYRFAGGCR